jgi:hypothetical protein
LIVGGFGAESVAPVFDLLTQALGNRLELQSQPISPASQWMIDEFTEDGDVDDYVDDDDDPLPPLLRHHEYDSSDDEGDGEDDKANNHVLLQEDSIPLVDCRDDFDAYRSSQDSDSKPSTTASASTTQILSLAGNKNEEENEDPAVASLFFFRRPSVKLIA